MTTDHSTPMAGAASLPGPAAPAAAPSRRKLIPLFLIAAVATAGGLYYNHARHFEDTDDAQIDASISNISPRVSGTVVAVNVKDNQTVKAGDVLAELDPTDYEVALAQAKATLAQAEASFQAENPSVSMTETSNVSAVSSAEADVASAESGLVASDRELKQLTAQLEQARANARTASQDKERADKLHETGAISQSEEDTRANASVAASANVAAVTAALAGAQARYAQAQARITAARARSTELRTNAPRQIDVRKANVNVRSAALELARAQLHQAELNLGYVKIIAPIGGIIGRKALSIGDRLAAGQNVLAISATDELWVTANFRETQLRDMKLGQEAIIGVDAIGVELHGTIESIAGATGSRFSLFPPENASGNYVKVVQRIPVRIHLDPGQPGMERMRPGMSVEPEVRVR